MPAAPHGSPAHSRLVMAGTAFDTRGGISSVVEVYRSHGLFQRWPIEYLTTHRDGSRAGKLSIAARATLRLLWLLAAGERPVLHLHTASHASFWRKSVFMTLALAAGCPYIIHLHGGGFARFYEEECSGWQRRLVRHFLDRAARIVVLSSQWQSWMSGATRNPNIVCIPNPVPAFGARGYESGEPQVLFLGRLEAGKGVYDLLEALAGLRSSLPGLRATLAGDGELDAVRARVAELGLADIVELPGWVGPQQKAKLLAAASAFVLPSYAEGSPMSVLEAMSAGVPVVATPVGGVPDLIADGVNGLLVPPGDIETLTRVLHKLLGCLSLRKRLGTAARETARLRFDASSTLAALDRIYGELGLQQRSDAAPRARPLNEVA